MTEVEAFLVGPLSGDRYLDEGVTRPGGGALNMAYHQTRQGLRIELISRVAETQRELVGGFLDRHHIRATESLYVAGEPCTVDVRFASDRQPEMDNFVEGVLADFELGDDEVDRLASGTPTHLVLVDVVDHELHRLADIGVTRGMRLTGDFLSFRHFTVERFTSTMQHLDIGFVGWPGEPTDDQVGELVAATIDGGKMLVVTFGASGIRVIDARRPGQLVDRWFDVDARQVTGTTVGCGDAFIAAFLGSWHDGEHRHDLDRAIDAGRRLGAEATTWRLALPDDAFE